ncbi:MAG: SGNH/GDSL hydrolase family protein [Clostridia bacterium]|nr:SGNH/GDSL hydrolase family protein [Clostridia bacterium]
MSEYQVPDRLMAGEDQITVTDIRYFDPFEPPFDLYGFCQPHKLRAFQRLPDDIGENVNKGVRDLYRNTAGGRIRFSTDSDYVILRVELAHTMRAYHMPMTGSRGFDCFVDDPDGGRSTFAGVLCCSGADKADGYFAILHFKTRQHRFLTLNFPLYSDVTSLEIGLRENSTVGGGLPYRNRLPVVFAGSSITQGGCASRPGNCYQNMIARALNIDYLNLGFSGSFKAEDRIVDYMAQLPMSVFVSDYDHNAPTPEHLRETHCRMYQKIREKNPDLPYVMISRPDFIRQAADSIVRRNIILDTYRYALDKGDQNVYFIDGESFFKGEWEDCCTVDGTHPNDLGFRFMAEGIGNTLGKLKIR